MDAKRILQFLKDISANNNRQWFAEHKDEYTAVRTDFENGVAQATASIVTHVSLPTSRLTNAISAPI